MKHIKFVILSMLFMLFMPSAFAEVSVYINETKVDFTDQEPVTVNNRVLVPMRKIFEELGAYVDWIPETNTVSASKRFQNISLTIGAYEYFLDGASYPLDVPAIAQNNRTLVPVRIIGEGLGAEVIWDSENSRVLIYTEQGDYFIKDKYTDYWDIGEDGKVILTGRVSYPEILSEEPVCTAFNEYFYLDAQDTIEKKTQLYKESAELAYKEFGENYIPYMAERSFDVTYNCNGIISMLFADSDFTGGFHPSFEMFGITYDMEDGKRVECTDVIKTDISKLRASVKVLFEELIDENPDAYYYDAKECLDDVLSELNWYLSADGVHFFVNPYEISPYASGVVEVVYSQI